MKLSCRIDVDSRGEVTGLWLEGFGGWLVGGEESAELAFTVELDLAQAVCLPAAGGGAVDPAHFQIQMGRLEDQLRRRGRRGRRS